MEKSLQEMVVEMLFDQIVHECRKKATRANDREIKFDANKIKQLMRQYVAAEDELKKGGEKN